MEQQGAQKLALIDRKKLDLMGVRHVGSFDEKEIVLDTNLGMLYLKGEGLNITKLNLDDGSLSVEGLINAIEYKEVKSAKVKGKNMISRLMK